MKLTQWLKRFPVLVTLLSTTVLASSAHAADAARPVLDAQSAEPAQEVRGLKQQTHNTCWATGENIAAKARTDWGRVVAPGKKWTVQDEQCLASQFTKAVVEGALAGANNLAPGVPMDVLIRYSAFLDKQIEFFCKPPPGAGANLGQQVFDAWFKAATANANQKGLFQEVRESFARMSSGQRLTPRELTVAVGVAIILAARELAPTPF